MTFPSFTAGEVLRAQDMNAVGMWLVGSTTFTNTTTAFVNQCFTSDYQNYVIEVVAQASAPTDLYFRMRSGVNTPETGAVYDRFGFAWGTSATNLVVANLTAAVIADITNVGTNRTAGRVTLYGPNNTEHTITNGHAWGSNSGSVFFPTFRIETSTQYTGIEIGSMSTPTITGSLRVYGLRN
jgi:hypothetical protein